MEKRLIIALLAVILLLSFVTASFEVGEYKSLLEKYSPQSYFNGYVKLKLDKEPANSLFTTNMGDSIELLSLIKLNNVTYSCSPADCKSTYEVDGTAKQSLSFDINSTNPKIIGLKFTGEISSVDSINFSLQSNAGASCDNQVKIDFINDGISEKGNNKASSEICTSSKNYGCFVDSGEFEKPIVEETPYCQKINLSEAAGFKIGAWVKKSGAKQLEMVVYDKDGDEKAKCELPESTDAGAEVSCDINYSVMKKEEHYVCIKSKSGSTEHQIKSSSNQSSKCGFFGIPIKSATASYQIFAVAKKFDSVGTIGINDTFEQGSIAQDLIEDYLLDRYDLDCSDTCIVPIKFSTNYEIKQSITLSDLNLKYKKSAGNYKEENFYNLKEIAAKISMNEQRLDLNKAKFSVTNNISEYGNKTFILNLNGKEVFSQSIYLGKISTIESLTPLAVPAAYPMEYNIIVKEQNNSKIIKYTWAFGDGTNESTTTGEITHTYNEIKNYELKITIKDINGYESFKIFNITVGSPKDIAASEIQKKLGYVDDLKSEIGNMTGFYVQTLEKSLDLNNSENKLKELEINYTGAATDNDYIAIMKEVVKIKVPQSVELKEQIKDAEFYPVETNINLDILKKIGGGDYTGLEKDYTNAISGFMIDNLDIKITYKEIVGSYEQHDEKILRIFEMNIDKIAGGDYYIILNNISNLKFDKSYGEKTESNYVYISSTGNEKIIFLTTGDIDFIDLPVFMTPPLTKLNVAISAVVCNNNGVCDKSAGEDWKTCKDCSASWTILWIILGIFVVGLAVYIALQIWYQRQYENHLFKDRNSLYNLVQYINQAKDRGIEEDKIRQNLKKAGWGGEQIIYAIKKYHGRRTGMWELQNIFKIFTGKTDENKKI